MTASNSLCDFCGLSINPAKPGAHSCHDSQRKEINRLRAQVANLEASLLGACNDTIDWADSHDHLTARCEKLEARIRELDYSNTVAGVVASKRTADEPTQQRLCSKCGRNWISGSEQCDCDPEEPKAAHVCGAQGFGRGQGSEDDVCPACAAEETMPQRIGDKAHE
ncbi:MAG TPA: hypothetical protein VN660_13610 [Steroidobacteraceae bacterium]|nr:hypothetical protein [Steroidobacteraceae bacterium]